jgi:hypothetical protein
MLTEFNDLYIQLRYKIDTISSSEVSDVLIEISCCALRYLLDNAVQVDLVSLVPDKEYFYFVKDDATSRPVNVALFLNDPRHLMACWRRWKSATVVFEDFQKMIYTMAIAPSVVMELQDKGNKKQPATYFEYLVGHIFSCALGSEPSKGTTLNVNGFRIRLTMDYLFQCNPHIHLPVKLSSRERIAQVHVHQRMLDYAFGVNTYKGIAVYFSETKLDLKKREVTEICIPDQWYGFQICIANMYRTYYFDIPATYTNFSASHPEIAIKSIPEFFAEKDTILHQSYVSLRPAPMKQRSPSPAIYADIFES